MSSAVYATRKMTLTLLVLSWADWKEPGRSDEQKMMSNLARDKLFHGCHAPTYSAHRVSYSLTNTLVVKIKTILARSSLQGNV